MNPIESNRLEMDGTAGRRLVLVHEARILVLSMTPAGSLCVHVDPPSVVMNNGRKPILWHALASAILIDARDRDMPSLLIDTGSLVVGTCVFAITPDEHERISAWLSGALSTPSSAFVRTDAGALPPRA